jgi:hypothetical protein
MTNKLDEDIENLTKSQYSAIVRAMKLGKILRDKYPEMSNLYRDGLSQTKIAASFEICKDYGVTRKISINAVSYAISGCEDYFGVSSYDGLIPDLEERIRISEDHNQTSGLISGKQSHENQVGIHGMSRNERSSQSKKTGYLGGNTCYEESRGLFSRSPEKWSKDSQKSGKIGGAVVYQLKRGVHGRTRQQMGEDAKKGIRNSGFTPWIEKGDWMPGGQCAINEIDFAHYLSLQSRFRRRSQINLQLISHELNRVYHNEEEIRKSSNVKKKLYAYIKSIR